MLVVSSLFACNRAHICFRMHENVVVVVAAVFVVLVNLVNIAIAIAAA